MANRFNVDFIGIGTHKANTSWLAQALAAHPGVCFSVVKETNFFCRTLMPARSALARYDGTNIGKHGLFFRDCDANQLHGEFSPSYLLEPSAAQDIHRHYPHTKLIAVLREPVSRFISHYRYTRFTMGNERRPIGDLIRPDELLIRHGMYGQLLERYFRLFPRENIKILLYEEMNADPLRSLRETYAFLGLDESFVPQDLVGVRVNPTDKIRFRLVRRIIDHTPYILIWAGLGGMVGSAAWNYMSRFVRRNNYTKIDHAPVSQEVMDRIRELYTDDRRKLERLLGRDLSAVWHA